MGHIDHVVVMNHAIEHEDKQMTKRDLIELLKDIDDDATIGARWDDCDWAITGVSEGEEFDFVIECP